MSEPRQLERPVLQWASLLLFAACDTPTDPSPTGMSDTATVADTGAPAPTLRVVTWNVEGLGLPSSVEFQAAEDVLGRLDADIVGLQEVNETELTSLQTLASELGYLHVQFGGETPFGPLRNAVLTRLAPTDLQSWSAADLSGDPVAMDVTRQPVSATVETPWGGSLTVVSQHCKAGFEDVDEFRRVVDSVRTAQAADGATVLIGDFNADPRDDPLRPSLFTTEPHDAPYSYQLGKDVSNTMSDRGIANDPFAALSDAGFTAVDASQGDGRVATRDSGRWIDHILVDPTLGVRGIEIYDSQDEAESSLPKAGAPLARHLVRAASDHLPVVADLTTR